MPRRYGSSHEVENDGSILAHVIINQQGTEEVADDDNDHGGGDKEKEEEEEEKQKSKLKPRAKKD